MVGAAASSLSTVHFNRLIELLRFSLVEPDFLSLLEYGTCKKLRRKTLKKDQFEEVQEK